MRIPQILVAVGLGLGAVVLSGGSARADDAGQVRVVLLDFEGAQAYGVRKWVDERLRPIEGIDVVPKAVALQGTNPVTAKEMVAVAQRSELCAVVRGTTLGKSGKWTLTLDVIDGATGESIDSLAFESTWIMGIKNELDASLAERFEPVVRRCSSPASGADEQPEEAALEEPSVDDELAASAAEPETRTKPKPERPAGQKPSALQLELELPLFTRRFRWKGDTTQTLRSYRLDGLAPGLAGGVLWYPGAHFTSGVAAHVGLTGRYFRGFPASAEREGRQLDTKTQSYRMGVRVRIPVEPVEVGIIGEYGAHDYEVARDPVTGVTVVPNVAYRFVRPGVAVGATLGAFVAEATVGVRIVFDCGELESEEFFPDLTGFGLDTSLGAGVALGPVAVLLRGALERYRFELHPSTDSPSPYGAAEVAIDRGSSLALVGRLQLP